jgi:hypothetical protein
MSEQRTSGPRSWPHGRGMRGHTVSISFSSTWASRSCVAGGSGVSESGRRGRESSHCARSPWSDRKSAGPSHALFGPADSASARVSVVQGPGQLASMRRAARAACPVSTEGGTRRVQLVREGGRGETVETGQPHLGPGFVRPRALFVRPVDIVIDRRRSLRRVGRRGAVTNPGSLRVRPQARAGSNCTRAKASGPGAAGLACRVRASSRSRCPTFLLLAILRTPSRPDVIVARPTTLRIVGAS